MHPLRLALVAGVLVFAPGSASAATMTLDGGRPAPPDKSRVVESSEWSMPDEGGTVTRTDATGDYTATYTFPLPATIAEGGQAITIRAGATAEKNDAGGDTRFNASMTVSGDIVGGGSVNVQALAESAGEKSKTTEVTVQLTPRAGQAVVKVGIQDGPEYTYTYTAEEKPDATNVAKVTAVSGAVTVKDRGGQRRAVRPGDTVGAGLELFTEIDASVTLEFPDGSVMTIAEMSQVLIADLLKEGSRQMIRVAVKLGELDATINPQKAFQSDFKVDVPNYGTTAPRGTRFSVFFDPLAKVALMAVTEGTAVWDPVAPALAEVAVPADQEIEATRTTVSAPVAIGQAGARGGVNRVKARDLVLARLGRARKRCKLKPARSPSAVTVKGAGKGWLVSVTTTGKAKGKSTWTVKAGKAQPKNPLAKKIGRGCR